MSKLMIFELDGGTWDVIDPLIEQGRLPNLARLKKEGAWGILRSTKPMISPVIWATIFTGKTREQHGVRAFDAGSQQVRCKRLWDIAHEQGLVCGVCGSLSTWPPYDVGAFMIPDIMARGPETIPERLSLLQELVLQQLHGTGKSGIGALGYAGYALRMQRAGVKPQTLLAMAREVTLTQLATRPRRESYWRRALLLQQVYADVFERLYRVHQPDLVTYHYHTVDTLSHKYWHYSFPETFDVPVEEVSQYHEVIPSAYEAADRVLGQFLRMADRDTALMVLSDHGFCTSSEAHSRHTARLVRWIEVLGLKQAAVPIRLGRQHFLYFDDAAQVEPIAQVLASTYVKETGNPALRTVETRDDSLFFVPALERANGMTIVVPGYGEWPFDELFRDDGHVTSGVHHQEGIVIVSGPQIRPGIKLSDASVIDATPNMLTLLGLSMARDMDGRIWTEMFADRTRSHTPISYVDTYESEKRVEISAAYTDEERALLYQRLEDLGYL